MKKIMIMMTVITTITASNVRAAVGCMDNNYHKHSQHYYKKKLDPSLKSSLHVFGDREMRPTYYGALQYRVCSCPCEQYRAWYLNKHNESRGYCPECKHRGVPDRTSIQNTEDDHEELVRAFALFKPQQEANY